MDARAIIQHIHSQYSQQLSQLIQENAEAQAALDAARAENADLTARLQAITSTGTPEGEQKASEQVALLVEAIRLTQEYIQLPPIEGWAWYDTLRAVAPQIADQLKRDYRDPKGPREAGDLS
jgi:hypothetical protein